MPENPELAVIAVFMQKHLPGYTITNLKYEESKKINLKSLTLPIRITGVSFKGKKLVFMLEGDKYIVFSLGMSGHFCLGKENERKHTRVEFELTKNSEDLLDKSLDKSLKQYLYFDDTRKFGIVEVCTSKNSLIDRLDKVGPDFLTGNISYEYWLNASKKFAKKQVCQFMLDQKYVSGIGNIYRADICYLAKINPTRTVSSLSKKELLTLYKCSYKIIHQAFKAGSSKGYRDPEGKSGQYEYLVYMQKKDALGNPVISEKCKDGRTIHWVPAVQK